MINNLKLGICSIHLCPAVWVCLWMHVLTVRAGKRKRAERGHYSAALTGWFVTFSVSTIFHIFNGALWIFFPSRGLGSAVYHRDGMSITVCVLVLHACERERGAVQGGVEELGGLTVGRQMGQRGGGWCSREQERERRRREDSEQIGWKRKRGKGRDNFMGVGRRCFSEHRKNAGCVCDPPAAAHTEAFRHLWIKLKMVDKSLLSTRGKKKIYQEY